MSLASAISALFGTQEPFRPQLQLQEGHSQRYRIEMDNQYSTLAGKRVKTQKLVSDFTRTIVSVPRPRVALTEIHVGPVHFSEQGRPPVRWTFADGLRLPHHLFHIESIEDLKQNAGSAVCEALAEQNRQFSEVFARFPKLPAVYLLIMQVMDIATFDEFSCLLSSSPSLFSSPAKEHRMDTMTSVETPLGFGLYGESSHFRNGDFYSTFLGFSFTGGRACLLCEFRCDATLTMTDGSPGFARTRQGKSYYTGVIHVDVTTGLPVLGTMQEYVFTGQDAKAPQSTCRMVRLELIEEASEGKR